jgi:glycosyltransferase involved in cell wall biosynthesis
MNSKEGKIVNIKQLETEIFYRMQERERLISYKLSNYFKLKSKIFGNLMYRKASNFSKPKVSIIGIFFNQEKYIHKWMDCIQNQTLKDIEIICVDGGGGKDNSVKVLKRYAKYDKRIKLVLHDKNYSINVARIDGVKIAKGDYIQFLDGDDYLVPNALKSAYNFINSKKVDVVQFKGIVNFQEHKLMRSSNQSITNYINKAFLNNYPKKFKEILPIINYPYSTVWNKMYSNKIVSTFINYIPNEFINVGEDFVFNCYLFNYANSIEYLDEFLVYYSVGKGSYTKKKVSSGYLFDMIVYYNNIIKCILKLNIYLENESRFINYFKELFKNAIINIEDQERDNCKEIMKDQVPQIYNLLKIEKVFHE